MTVADALAVLGTVFAAAGISTAALRAALSVVMGYPPDRQGFWGPATAQTARLNLIRRAQFLVASSRRITTDLRRSHSENKPIYQALLDAGARERRFYGQHQEALWTRMRAAAQVDTAVMDHGPLLGWYAVHDAHTSAECRAADRHNFRADQMPAIGFPGAVHPHCRCMPGPPVPGAPMVGQRAPARRERVPA